MRSKAQDKWFCQIMNPALMCVGVCWCLGKGGFQKEAKSFVTLKTDLPWKLKAPEHCNFIETLQPEPSEVSVIIAKPFFLCFKEKSKNAFTEEPNKYFFIANEAFGICEHYKQWRL